MSVPSPSRAGRAWDKVIIGGVQLPGLATVVVEGSNDVQKNKPKGGHGASMTFQGRNPADVKITVTLHDILPETATANPAEEAWAQFQEALPRVFARRAADESGAGLAITHPMTSLFGVEAIKIEKIRGELKGADFVLTIDATEFLPPPKGASVTKTEKTLDPRNQSLAPDLDGGGGHTAMSVSAGAGVTTPGRHAQEARRPSSDP